ncbi:MAG TPA: glycoside hydrolase, partial [Fibrobacteria bacterium]|nr:glycoside hydrolase [Fibrobacteria bacterium]
MPARPCPAVVPIFPCILLATLFATFPEGPRAQITPVGKGSYTTALPVGRLTPQDSTHQPAYPQVTADFRQPAQTNEWWSSFLYKRVPNAHQWSGKSYPHPLSVRGAAEGLEMGYPDKPTRGLDWEWTTAGGAYIYPHVADLVVGIEGLAAPSAKTAGYSDWAVTADWTDGPRNLRATMAHGNPFVFFTVTGGPAKVAFTASPVVWFQDGGTLGVTVNGRHYGIFGPTGSTWTVSGQARISTLAGKNYLSVAVLPDGLTDDAARKTALALFRA